MIIGFLAMALISDTIDNFTMGVGGVGTLLLIAYIIMARENLQRAAETGAFDPLMVWTRAK